MVILMENIFFSAALLLVMVNTAFPYDETNAQAMDTALNLLRNMADRGNTYLGSRHSLLLELRAALGEAERVSSASDVPKAANVPTMLKSDRYDGAVIQKADAPPSPFHGDWQQPPDLSSLQNISFQFDLDDDPALWEGALNQIDFDMDMDWS